MDVAKTKIIQYYDWAGSQDLVGANSAIEVLGEINPQAQCFSDAQILIDKIGKRVKQIDQRILSAKLKED